MDQHLSTDDINFLDQAADIPVSMWPADAADALTPLPERPVDWAGHIPAQPGTGYALAVESLRQHADRLEGCPAVLGDVAGRAAAAVELRAAAMFLEAQRPPLPRRPRPSGLLRPGLVQALLDNAAVQQVRAEAVDALFVVAPRPADSGGEQA